MDQFIGKTAMAKILLVTNDENFSEFIQNWLEHYGHLVHDLSWGGNAMTRLTFDLVILDWELPDISALNMCKQFRKQGHKVPLLILGPAEHQEAGLNGGADDYLIKRFHPSKLSTRIRELLYRTAG